MESLLYSDGFFSINMVGIRFNNSNWKYILQMGPVLLLLVGGLFVSLFVVAKKYE